MSKSIGIRLEVSDAFRPRANYVLRTALSPFDVECREGSDYIGTQEVLQPLFRILSRQEEWESDVRDRHGRFPFSESKEDPTLPRLNAFSRKLGEQFGLERRALPGGADFVVVLSHDVDRLRNLYADEAMGLVRRSLWHLVQKGSIGKSFSDVGELMRRAISPNRLWNFEELREQETARDFSSTYFFSSAGVDEFDNRYDITSPRIRSVIQNLLMAGQEVGLHRSIACPDLGKEVDALSDVILQPVLGNRCHYLSFDVRNDFAALDRAGLAYDSTLGYAEQEGFRSGWTFPYHPYDLENERPFEVLEIPLAIMDTTLIDYRKLNPEEAWDACRKILDTVRDEKGAVAILWHNGRAGAWHKLYLRILDTIRKEGGLGITASDLVQAWKPS